MVKVFDLYDRFKKGDSVDKVCNGISAFYEEGDERARCDRLLSFYCASRQYDPNTNKYYCLYDVGRL